VDVLCSTIEILDYYEGAGISAKTGNLRPEFVNHDFCLYV